MCHNTNTYTLNVLRHIRSLTYLNSNTFIKQRRLINRHRLTKISNPLTRRTWHHQPRHLHPRPILVTRVPRQTIRQRSTVNTTNNSSNNLHPIPQIKPMFLPLTHRMVIFLHTPSTNHNRTRTNNRVNHPRTRHLRTQQTNNSLLSITSTHNQFSSSLRHSKFNATTHPLSNHRRHIRNMGVNNITSLKSRSLIRPIKHLLRRIGRITMPMKHIRPISTRQRHLNTPIRITSHLSSNLTNLFLIIKNSTIFRIRISRINNQDNRLKGRHQTETKPRRLTTIRTNQYKQLGTGKRKQLPKEVFHIVYSH